MAFFISRKIISKISSGILSTHPDNGVKLWHWNLLGPLHGSDHLLLVLKQWLKINNTFPNINPVWITVFLALASKCWLTGTFWIQIIAAQLSAAQSARRLHLSASAAQILISERKRIQNDWARAQISAHFLRSKWRHFCQHLERNVPLSHKNLWVFFGIKYYFL